VQQRLVEIANKSAWQKHYGFASTLVCVNFTKAKFGHSQYAVKDSPVDVGQGAGVVQSVRFVVRGHDV